MVIFSGNTRAVFFRNKERAFTGGVAGVVIGLSDIDRSLSLYQDILGYDTVVYDGEGIFDDFDGLNGVKCSLPPLFNSTLTT